MATDWMDRERFLQEYELQLETEFESSGRAAEWAPGNPGPRFWGSEDASITLKDDDPNKGNVPSAAAALSADARLLAVSTNAVIRIYDTQSRQMYSELVGYLNNVGKLHFAPIHTDDPPKIDNDVTHKERGKYLLLSEGAEVSGDDGQVISWSLDSGGRLLSRTMPFAVENMADRALSAISIDLDDHHGLSVDDMDRLRAGFVETLKVADANNRVKHLSVWDGHFPHFGTYPVSHHGRIVLYITHGKTTQNGMRPSDGLPQIVVMDVASQTEVCRLRGHTDAIMWAGWSPDDKTIATACWDQYFKIWDAQTGECRHTIGPTKGQNWSGAFSPDNKHLTLSGGRPVKVAVYDIETGEQVASLAREGLKLDNWIRCFTWNPAGSHVAVENNHGVVLWEPYGGKAEAIIQLKTDRTLLTRYNSFIIIKWADGGKKLLLQDTEGTVFVWDRQRNWKWRFQHPRGTESEYDSDVFFVDGTQTVISLDGDGKVRYWKL